VTLAVRDEGPRDALPVVFLHGVMLSGRVFQGQVERFGARHRVIVPDFRGHGESEKTVGGHTVATYAADLRALLKALDVQRPVLVGWSMGAMVAWEYLQAYGQDQVQGLVVVDQPPSDFAWDGYGWGMFSPHVLDEAVTEIQTDLGGVAGIWAGLMLHDEASPQAALLTEEILKVPPSIGTSILVNQTLRDYRPFMAEIRVPTLVAFGGDDKATPPDAGRWIASQIPGARLEIFDASSHCPFLEEPEAFDAALQSFLDTL
jgi:pimeloyl-ACP methyl ester carboxylesterase